MCFKNLPIEFDEQGRATLKEAIPDPYDQTIEAKPPPQLSRDQIEELLARNGYLRNVDFDPVTRVAGALAFHSVCDLEKGKVLEARSMATLFRGYEVIAMGRDPRDAIFITSRACGVCGGVHSVTSAMATEMAFGICPPPLGICVRNLALALEFLYDHPLHLFLLAGPDYSEQIVRQTNPELFDRAKGWECAHAGDHGFRTMADLMEGLNPLTGSLYLEALHMTRVVREAYALICGKYPHPQTIVPGGMSTTVTPSVMNEMFTRLRKFFDYSRKTVGIWEDITRFFYEADDRYREVGARPATMVDTGIFDHHEAYDAKYGNAGAWGKRRYLTPGAVVDGELVTTDLHQINMGTEEFVEHSYYEVWASVRHETDPAGNPLSKFHPWNEETRPKPTGQNWREKYSWAKSPRWDRRAAEAGSYARLWTTAAARERPESDYMESTGESLRMVVPRAETPEAELEWRIPEVWNAFERNLARAYCIPETALIAMENWDAAMDLMKRGETKVSTRFEVPKKGRRMGVGFWGAGRGWLTHHLELEDGVIANYQILTPSTWNASPQDPWGNPGPYEEAVLNTPFLETWDDPDDFKGVDILRTIRSFDPCMPCTTHVHVDGTDRVMTTEVNTCACGAEE
ncbi:MAG: nickel-dependent hydrogenase large subunit [Gemmatimonadota bacterium]|nr:nickel-dependent hydrogenase large subunit [Gemmatimonadota bacterium]